MHDHTKRLEAILAGLSSSGDAPSFTLCHIVRTSDPRPQSIHDASGPGWVRRFSSVEQFGPETTLSLSDALRGEWVMDGQTSHRFISGAGLFTIHETNEHQEGAIPVLRQNVSILHADNPAKKLQYAVYWGELDGPSVNSIQPTRIGRIDYRLILIPEESAA